MCSFPPFQADDSPTQRQSDEGPIKWTETDGPNNQPANRQNDGRTDMRVHREATLPITNEAAENTVEGWTEKVFDRTNL